MTKIYDINTLKLENHYNDMNDFIEKVSETDLEKLKSIYNGGSANVQAYNLNDIKLCSPIINPRKDILCLGLNYKAHVKETSHGFNQEIDLPEYPIYFSKRVNETVGPEEGINPYENITSKLDYEVELAVIIGKEGINIPKEEAEDYIFGYTIINDVSARDLQTRHSQWFRGKSLDSFTPLGPCIVHKSEMKLPLNLGVTSIVNGEVRQQGNTRDLIFDIPTIIHDLSQGMTLKPGDIIATGTPSGVGMGFNPPKFLKRGDIVECKVEGIGVLRNIVED